jgi:nicotinate-nucleotide--dimethylbenzimidazole phosphoribosyltransferase
LILDWLGAKPLLDLNMRLGEGTGAALAFHLIEASTRILREMATFDEAGVSDKE